jgi:glycine oxidase
LFKRFKYNNNRITEIASKAETYAVNSVVITAGAWTGQLCKQLFGNPEEVLVEVFPVKGQMLILDAGVNTLDTMVLENNQYLIPRRDGKILCGSTVEYTDFDKSTSKTISKMSCVNCQIANLWMFIYIRNTFLRAWTYTSPMVNDRR